MGLDTTHDCWHGAYSSFSRWRDILAKAAGYTLVESEDGHGFKHQVVVGLNYDIDERRYYGRMWAGDVPAVEGHDPDPMLFLHLHSDCEGVIKQRHQLAIADRLESLLPALEEIDGGGHIGNAADKTRKFIAGLRDANARDEEVEFH